jgi:2-isopropylmalate synthase
LHRISRLVSKYTGFVVPPNKAIVGNNAFRHEAGIHQDGVLKERSTYEIMRPEDVGFIETGLFLGKHSGRHAFKVRLKDLGVVLKETELDKAFIRFKSLADKKKEIFDEDLIAIVEDEVKAFKDVWILEKFSAVCGTGKEPEVTVVLRSKGKTYSKSASGDGIVDSCYKAIESIVNIEGRLLDYSIKSVTQGKDALGEVSIKVRMNGKTMVVTASSTDILEASAKAYINAVNKVLALEKK